ncbi:pentatricopeptide repeat-containing protein [Tanacetum coccineum]
MVYLSTQPKCAFRALQDDEPVVVGDSSSSDKDVALNVTGVKPGVDLALMKLYRTEPQLGKRFQKVKDSESDSDSDTPLQSEISFFSETQQENELMKEFEWCARQDIAIDIECINGLLHRSLLRKDYSFAPRVRRLVKANKIRPTVDTFRHLIDTYCKRREFRIATTLLDWLNMFNLEETAHMRNTLAKELFESGIQECYVQAWVQHSLIIKKNMLTSDSYVYLLRYGTEDIDRTLELMECNNIKPNKKVFRELIDAYTRKRKYNEAKKLREYRLVPNPVIETDLSVLIVSGIRQDKISQKDKVMWV